MTLSVSLSSVAGCMNEQRDNTPKKAASPSPSKDQQIVALALDLHDANEDNARLAAANSQQQAAIATLAARVTGLERQRHKLQRARAAARAAAGANARLRRRLSAAQAAAHGARQQADDAHAAMWAERELATRNAARHAAARQEADSLAGELAGTEDWALEATTLLAESEAATAQLRQALAAAAAEHARTTQQQQQQLTDMREAVAAQDVAVAELEGSLADMQGALCAEKAMTARLSSALEHRTRQARGAVAAMVQQSRRVAALESKMAAVKLESAALSASLAAAAATLAQAQAQVSAHVWQVARADAGKQAAQAQVRALAAEVARLSARKDTSSSGSSGSGGAMVVAPQQQAQEPLAVARGSSKAFSVVLRHVCSGGAGSEQFVDAAEMFGHEDEPCVSTPRAVDVRVALRHIPIRGMLHCKQGA